MHLSLLDEHLLLGRYGALALLRVGRRFLRMSRARDLGLHSLDLSLSHGSAIEKEQDGLSVGVQSAISQRGGTRKSAGPASQR